MTTNKGSVKLEVYDKFHKGTSTYNEKIAGYCVMVAHHLFHHHWILRLFWQHWSCSDIIEDGWHYLLHCTVTETNINSLKKLSYVVGVIYSFILYCYNDAARLLHFLRDSWGLCQSTQGPENTVLRADPWFGELHSHSLGNLSIPMLWGQLATKW